MKRLLAAILFLVSCLNTTVCQPLIPDTVAMRLWRQVATFPQEKLYAQTDRAEYVVGDTIWVRNHLVSAAGHVPTYASRYIYVELADPMGQIVSCNMMRQDIDGAIYGYVPTSTDMPSGQYLLRAYTKYMADNTPGYLFQRPLRLHNTMENAVCIETEVRSGTLRLYVKDPKTGRAIHNGDVQIKSNDGEVAFTGNTDTGINIHTIDVGSKHNWLLVRIGNYEEYVPINRGSIDLQVMPEGGHMVMGQFCRVAYKAVERNGMGLDMAAVVTDNDGNVVAESSATHRGMGMFCIIPQPGRSYTLACTSADGRTAKVQLPDAQTDAPTLSVTQNSGNIIARALFPVNCSQDNTLWLVAQQGGCPLYADKMERDAVSFNRDMFSDGIVHFVLADSDMNIISERMVFVWNGTHVYRSNSALTGRAETQHSHFVTLSLPDTLNASCAVSITDAADVHADTVQDIVSALLLSQDLRGNIENPVWYFADRGRTGQLDLLMMTQGWRRYDIAKVLRGGIYNPISQPETSMRISGKATSTVSSKGKKNVMVTMSSTRGGIAETATTDDRGRFAFEGFELPDSTSYMVVGRSAKGSSNIVLLMDSVAYPSLTHELPTVPGIRATDNADALQRASDRIAISSGGRTAFLPEVTVLARYTPKTEYESLAKINGLSIKENALKDEGNKSLLDILKTMVQTGVSYSFAQMWFFYRNCPVGLIIDETTWLRSTGEKTDDSITYNILSTVLSGIRARDTKQIDIIKGHAVGTLLGMASYDNFSMDRCVIAITTNGGTSLTHCDVAALRPLGYQRPAAFYNPKYETPEDYALRQTVYWHPTLLIKDGKASLRFLDNGAKRYRVTVEGVDSKGTLIHLQKEIE